MKETKEEVEAETTEKKIEDRITMINNKQQEERHSQEIIDSNKEKPTKEARNQGPRKTEEKTQKGQTEVSKEVTNKW